MSLRLKLILTGYFLSIQFTINAQTGYEELKLKTQNFSYYDSVRVFETGKLAIEQAKKEGHPELESEILIFYGNNYYYRSLIDKAAETYQQALNVALNHKNNHFINLAKIRLAYILSDKGQKKLAREIFQYILNESNRDNDYINKIEALNALALFEDNNNHSAQSAAYYVEALKTAEANNDKYYTAVILNNLGLIKLGANNNEQALKDFEKAYQYAVQLNNPRLAFHLSNNIALIYLNEKKYKEALQQHEKNLLYARLTDNLKELYVAFINISSVYTRINDLNGADKYIDSAIFLMKKAKHHNELSKGYIGKSQILIKKKEYQQALKYLDSALIISDSLKNLENQTDIFYFYSIIFEIQGKYKEALEKFKQFKQYNDSLEEKRNNKYLSEIQVQYEVDKKQDELEKEKQEKLLLEKENRLKDSRIYFILLSSIAIILLSGAFVYIRYNRQKRLQHQKFSQQLIQSLENERSRIAKDLHDDIGQSLSSIKSKIALLHKEDNNSVFKHFEEQIGKLIEQTRQISRRLYPSYLEKIGLIRSVAQLMEKTQNNSNLICSFDIDEEIEKLNVDKKTHLYRIIQECINNTIKHAEAKSLKVVIEKVSPDEFILIYRDNGIGVIKSKKDQAEGIGFMIIKERTNILNGNLSIEDNEKGGFKLILNFRI